jgi:4-carboxymuconolactone decarboxylase
MFNNIEEQLVFDFAAEANILKKVTDQTFNSLIESLGQTAAIDIVGICGYYSLISMTLNVFKIPEDTDQWPLAEIKDFSAMLKS